VNCRICGGNSLGEVIDLGPMPLVNNLPLRPDEDCPRRPLKVVFCRECSLAQLTESAPPDEMFRDYRYFSSQSQTMVAHARDLVARHVRPGQRVIEIASNDGYLLGPAAERDAIVLGIDPAENIAACANANGIPTRCAYFNRQTARQLRDEVGPADVIFANNVLAHVPDPHEIAEGIAMLLAPHGLAHVEVPYVVRLLASCAFDTIYHEHYSYYSVSALRRLFNEHDLRIVGVEEIPLHGGSLHLQIARDGEQTHADDMCAHERQEGLFGDAYYADFSARVRRLADALLAAIDRFHTVGGYGAAAKAVVVLNFLSLGPDRIPWVADFSPHKQGRYIPGTGQPIVEPERLLLDMPEACVLFPWNIRDEIRRRNRTYTDRGGRFIISMPEVTVS
jgi:SAM-dependent methyltransferase